MSKNDISEDTLQNITKGVTFSQSISSIFRVTFSLAVDMFERASTEIKSAGVCRGKWISLFVFAKVNLGAAKDLQNRLTAINNSSKRSSFGFHP
jgi:predicted DNA binding protein